MRSPRAGETVRVERMEHEAAGALRVRAEQPPAMLDANERGIDNRAAAQDVMTRRPRCVGAELVDDAAVLGAHFRRAVHVSGFFERVRIRHVAAANDHRRNRRAAVVHLHARNAAAHALRMTVLLDEQIVASVVAVRKRIGHVVERFLRRQPANVAEGVQILEAAQRTIERRDADVPRVVPRPLEPG